MSQKITSKQLKAAHMIAAGEKTEKIAETLKLRRETISRWKRLPKFKEEIDKVMQASRERSCYRLIQLSDAAITAIHSEFQFSKFPEKRTVIALNILKMLGMDKIMHMNVTDTHMITVPEVALQEEQERRQVEEC